MKISTLLNFCILLLLVDSCLQVVAQTSATTQPMPDYDTNRAPQELKNDPRLGDYLHAIEKSMNTPIDFWGKVVDENGNPIANARVEYAVENNPHPEAQAVWETLTTDANGQFSVLGKKGASLSVRVSKAGYDKVTPKERDRGGSFGLFLYSDAANPHVHLPTQNAPAIFYLRKKGVGAVLKAIRGGSVMIKNDGTPVEISLTTCRAVPSNGDFKVELWANDQNKDAKKRYDWKCRITVPGGGLIVRQGEYDFQSPETGYQATDEINMSQTAERWKDKVERNYFVKLANGSYERIVLNVVVSNDSFFDVEGYLNPTPGDRNLEFDPAKQIK